MTTAAEARAAAIGAFRAARLDTFWNTLYDIRKTCEDKDYAVRLTKALAAINIIDNAIETIAEMHVRLTDEEIV